MGRGSQSAEYVEGEGERLMAVIFPSILPCTICGENMYILGEEEVTVEVDGEEFIRIKRTSKCLNGHNEVKIHRKQPKMIIN